MLRFLRCALIFLCCCTVAIVMTRAPVQATLIIEGLADDINDGLFQTDQMDDNLLANLE